MAEVNCETDFVAKTPMFKEFVRGIAQHIMENNPGDVEALLAQSADSGTVSDLVKQKIGEIGENR